LGHLLCLHEAYRDRADFLFIAIRDAGHADPNLSFLAGAPGASPEERVGMVRQGLEFYKVPFPGLIDEDAEVERAYRAYPQRLVIVGIDGRIVFDGGLGAQSTPSPWDLEEVEEHLRAASSTGSGKAETAPGID